MAYFLPEEAAYSVRRMLSACSCWREALCPLELCWGGAHHLCVQMEIFLLLISFFFGAALDIIPHVSLSLQKRYGD